MKSVSLLRAQCAHSESRTLRLVMLRLVLRWGIHITLGVLACAGSALATTPQVWTASVVEGSFPSESSALSAVRSKGGKYQYAEILQSSYQSGSLTRYIYKARPRDLNIGEWYYWGQGIPVRTAMSEEEARDVALAFYKEKYPECKFSEFTPIEKWKRQTYGLGGHDGTQSRIHRLKANAINRCTGDWSTAQWRSRVVECPKYFTSSTNGQCTLLNIASLYSQPMPCSQCDLRDNPINVSLGAKIQKEIDFKLGWLEFSRTYKSQSKTPGGLGRHWTHSLNIQLIQGDAAYAAVYPNGSMMVFRNVEAIDGSGVKVKYANKEYSISTGTQRFVFGDFGQASRVENSDGTSIVFELDSLRRISKATHSSGRHLKFTYMPDPESTDVADISDEDGILVSYMYDNLGRLTDAVFRDGTSRHYFYEDPNFIDGLTGIRDESEQRYSTYAYDANGLAVLTEHANGTQRGVAEYLEDGTTRYTDASGLSESIRFTEAAPYRKISSISRNNVTSTVNYAPASSDFRRRITSRSDSLGNVERFTYQNRTDPIYGKVAVTTATKTTTAGESSTKETWIVAETNQKIKEIANGVATSYLLNNTGQPLSITRTDVSTGLSRQSTFTYCDLQGVAASTCPREGLLLSVDGPLPGDGDKTTYEYFDEDASGCNEQPRLCTHRKGDLWKETKSLDQVTEVLSYDGASRPLSVRDRNGVITSYTYGPRGWLTSSRIKGASDAQDRVEEYEYWPTGLIKRVTRPDGDAINYIYDPAHRLTSITDNTGNRINYTLDNSGNRISEITTDIHGEAKRSLSRVYNNLNQMITLADATGTPTDFTYDANGNIASITDALSRQSKYEYDSHNRIKRTLKDAEGIEADSRFTYNELGNLVTATDPKGIETRYIYEGLGNLAKQVSPDTGSIMFTYDAAGNRTSRTDARNKTAIYSYDALQRLTEVALASGKTTYTYDAIQDICLATEVFSKGHLTKIEDSSGTTKYCYNRFGDLTRKVQSTNGISLAVSYLYSSSGQLTATTYPDGSMVDYARDEQGRITQIGVTSAAGTRQLLLTRATYHPFGPVAAWTYGNGRQMTRTLDMNYRPSTIHEGRRGGLSISLKYDPAGNLLELSEPGSTAPAVSFHYDSLGRLTQLRDGLTQAVIDGYSYDKTGNRTSTENSAGISEYTYPQNSHHLLQVGAASRAYDAAGNAISIDGNAKEFFYDDSGRMSSVAMDGETIRNYRYNGKGERVHSYQGTQNVYTLYDESGHWMGDYDANGTPIQQAVWMNDLPVGLLSAAENTLNYIQPDHLGTPRVVIDPLKDEVIWKWDLKGEAFGSTPPDQDPDRNGIDFILDMRFPGQRFDAFTELNYNYFRDYDPQTGRYVQSDPFGILAGSSTYSYVESNPLQWEDALGLIRKLDPSSRECQDLAEKIRKIKIDIAKRQFEYDTNPLGLPENLPGTSPRHSRQGHLDVIIDLQKNLKDREQLYIDKCTNDPEPDCENPSPEESSPDKRIAAPEMTPGAKAAAYSLLFLLFVAGALSGAGS